MKTYVSFVRNVRAFFSKTCVRFNSEVKLIILIIFFDYLFINPKLRQAQLDIALVLESSH